MAEYIIEIPDECFANGAVRDVYYPDERDDPMALAPLVRCRDCYYYVEADDEYATRDWCTYWERRLYEDDGFCAWGEDRQHVEERVALRIAEEAEKRLGGI